MVCAIHDELDSTGQRTELAYDQAVSNERVVIKNIPFKVLRIFRVVVIGVVPNDDIRIRHSVLDEAHLRETGHGVLV